MLAQVLELSTWPIAERAQTVDQVVGLLTGAEWKGALVVGAKGVGKSSIATSVLERLAVEHSVFQIRGGIGSRATRYGALGVLLADLDIDPLGDPAFVLTEIVRSVAPIGSVGPLYIFVDDADTLDELSAAALAQLARSRIARLVLVTREISSLSTNLTGLWRDRLLEQINLRSLTLGETITWLEEGLRAKISFSAVRALWRMAGGTPGLLSRLMAEAVNSGAIELRDSTWVQTEMPLVHYGPEFRDIVADRWWTLDPEELRVLEIVSLGRSVPLRSLVAVCDSVSVDSLVKMGILSLDPLTGHHVRVDSELLAEVTRARVPSGRSDELRRSFIGAGPSLSTEAAVDSYFPDWALSCKGALAMDDALSAARAANYNLDTAAALSYLRATVGYEAHPTAVAQAVRAQVAFGNYAGARATVDLYHQTAFREPTLSEWVELFLAQSSTLLTHAQGWEEAVRILEKVRNELFPVGTETVKGMKPAELLKLRQQLVLAEADAAEFRGAYQEIAESLDNIIQDSPRCDPDFILLAQSRICESWAAAGRSQAAAEFASALVVEWNDPRISTATRVQSEKHLMLTGLLLGTWCQVPWQGLPMEDSHSSSVYLFQGLAHCLRGHGMEALELLMPLISQLEVVDPEGILELAYAAAAYSCGVQKDVSQAQAFLGVAKPTILSRRWSERILTKYFIILARAELDTSFGVVAALSELTDEAAQLGNTAYEMLFLNTAIRYGGDLEAQRLLEQIPVVDGAFAAGCRAYAAALLANDPSALLMAGTAALEMGHDLTAVHVAQAGVAASHSGTEKSILRACQQLLVRSRSRLAVGGADPTVKQRLTSRELEVARRAAMGATNRDVARGLHVSVRTVEGHLYRAFEKLKIAGRLELPAALQAWAEGPS